MGAALQRYRFTHFRNFQIRHKTRFGRLGYFEPYNWTDYTITLQQLIDVTVTSVHTCVKAESSSSARPLRKIELPTIPDSCRRTWPNEVEESWNKTWVWVITRREMDDKFVNTNFAFFAVVVEV